MTLLFEAGSQKCASAYPISALCCETSGSPRHHMVSDIVSLLWENSPMQSASQQLCPVRRLKRPRKSEVALISRGDEGEGL